ncbi:proteasome activator pa28 REG alpha beta subunit [Polyporus arcularius HHB13444]|uniref:Proteasome activator pa28 REG alpha beta subunit n=1 Tax=Polyporus arcularius HHB13444 TaxID=1314778 RepID=A0A5C3PJY6_9APHY|nr:proteasome activator pa28 REG alpha beta subunit [Polyporus arcularius HHB13444]
MSRKLNIDNETKKGLDAFRESAAVAAEEVVFKTFPQKVLDIQKLIDSTFDTSSPFHLSNASRTTDFTVYPAPTSSAEHESKKRKLDTGDAVNGAGVTATPDYRHVKNPAHMVSNKHNIAIHEQLKRECEILAELCDKVKLWINLSMPKIEDGDNFGVQIQEDVLSELHRSQESAYNLRDAGRQDYLTRAKICSKIMKYPHLDDYALALREHDEKQLYVARQNLYDLRSIYSILTDILHKNIDKIRSPKGNNATSMY